jgi:hypothetical protein
MMRVDGFGRSLAFAAIAAAGVVPWLLLARPFVGAHGALALYAIGVTALYVAGLAGATRRGLAAGALAAILASAVSLLTGSLAELAIGIALTMATLRSGLLFRRRGAARALAVEGFLVAAGLLVARVLADGSSLGIALSIWGFLLVQSLFFLIGGAARRERGSLEVDPFDRARSRLTELLEENAI